MERGAVRIYPHSLPETIPRTGRPWSLARSALDPLVAVGVYFLVLHAWGGTLTPDDLILIFLGFILIFPGDLPFKRFSGGIAANLLMQWFRVVCAVTLYWAVKVLLLRLGFQAEAHVVLAWLVATPAMQVLLHYASPRIAPLLFPLYPSTKVVIVGVNNVAMRIAQLINEGEAEGQQFLGYFDDRQSRLEVAQNAVIGRMSDVSQYVKVHGINVIYISMPMSSQPRIKGLLEELRDTTASIYFLPDIFLADLIQGRVTALAGLPLVSVCDTPFHGTDGTVKRMLDVVLTVASMPLMLPLMALIAVSVRMTSPGPAIFKQRRYGLDGKEIVVWKFRTMSTLEDGQSTYTQVTRNDARVTSFGRFLRKTSLDELPQLLNVLAGSMSLVGPRPHALAVNEQYRRLIPGYMVRHKVKPGITGWAQVNGCRGGDDLDSMRRRTEFDLAYLRSWSLTLDLLIILKTAKMLVVGDKRAY
jgi:putative colanic acid biosynthesis UDP-glucose lipid carrier transferase